MIGATIYWIGSNIGASTGEKGLFEITSKHTGNSKLVASFVGYISDTIEITNQSFVEFKLIEVKPLNDVVVQGKRNGIIISNISPIKTEIITQSELKKAACCDLAGCFETQATVQPQTTNVITNSKELRILGISGVYNQVLIDGLPMIQGLSYTYGISGIQEHWLKISPYQKEPIVFYKAMKVLADKLMLKQRNQQKPINYC
jgi:hypothetical protein